MDFIMAVGIGIYELLVETREDIDNWLKTTNPNTK